MSFELWLTREIIQNRGNDFSFGNTSMLNVVRLVGSLSLSLWSSWTRRVLSNKVWLISRLAIVGVMDKSCSSSSPLSGWSRSCDPLAGLPLGSNRSEISLPSLSSTSLETATDTYWFRFFVGTPLQFFASLARRAAWGLNPLLAEASTSASKRQLLSCTEERVSSLDLWRRLLVSEGPAFFFFSQHPLILVIDAWFLSKLPFFSGFLLCKVLFPGPLDVEMVRSVHRLQQVRILSFHQSQCDPCCFGLGQKLLSCKVRASVAVFSELFEASTNEL